MTYLELLLLPFINWISQFKLASDDSCFQVILPCPPAFHVIIPSVSPCTFSPFMIRDRRKNTYPDIATPRGNDLHDGVSVQWLFFYNENDYILHTVMVAAALVAIAARVAADKRKDFMIENEWEGKDAF